MTDEEDDFRALKSRLNIVEVVSAVVDLRPIPGSKNLRGLSPFEPEKSPSFFVSPDKGLYKCFRTGKAGDAIRFVMETERLDFFAACKVLAARYGVPLVEQNFIE